MKAAAISKRLLSAVKYVRRGAVFADVGTDHAYLPIYLLKSGLIERAVLSDINEGPLSSARNNALGESLIDRVELVLADGAAALADKGITDVAIFGMGGELIADIIERAPFLRDEKIRLILQPMTKQAHLCEYLRKSGFSAVGEAYTSEGGKHYRTICVHFGNSGRTIDESFDEIGFTDTPCEEIKEKIDYLKQRRASLVRSVNGKRGAGIEVEDEKRALELVTSEIARLEAL